MNKLKKTILTVGLGMGLAAGITSPAMAYKPGHFSWFQCQELKKSCDRGNTGSCWMYNTSNCSQ